MVSVVLLSVNLWSRLLSRVVAMVMDKKGGV